MKQHVQDGVKIYEYSQNEGDFHAENIKIENGGITFDFISPIENVTGVELGPACAYQHHKWCGSNGNGTIGMVVQPMNSVTA